MNKNKTKKEIWKEECSDTCTYREFILGYTYGIVDIDKEKLIEGLKK